MINQGGTAMITDLRSSSWEEGSGKRFRFNSSQFRDEKPTEATAGDAARANTADDIKVELTKPAKKDLSLSARVYFPVQHSIALLQAAKAGKTLVPRRPLRRLGEGREGLRHGLRHRPPQAAGQPTSKLPRGEERRGARPAGRPGRFRSRYFEPGSDKNDAVPVYELSFLFFENGVSRKLFIDYGEFAIQRRAQGDHLPRPASASRSRRSRQRLAASRERRDRPGPGRRLAPQPRRTAHAAGVAPARRLDDDVRRARRRRAAPTSAGSTA